MKAYTDIEQSKKLAEILPLESADMYYHPYPNDEDWYDIPNFGEANLKYNQLPCWSLSSLLNVLPKYIGDYGKCLYFDMGYYYCGYMVDGDFMLSIEETSADNPIDACMEMIVKLHEQNLL